MDRPILSGLLLLGNGKFPCESLQLLVPFLAETSDEWLLEESIDGHVQLLAKGYGIAADGPSVVVESHQAIGELLGADGIEGAGEGFGECRLSLAVCFLQHTEAIAVLMAGEDAVLTPHDACHQVAFLVGICHPLAVDDGLRLGRHLVPNGVEGVFYLGYLVGGDGCSRIPLDATDALALGIVATEPFCQDVGREQYVAHLQDGERCGGIVYHTIGAMPFCVR